MHLTVARLCLDCQEIHEHDRCPVCTSEAFGFIRRWVKVDETRDPSRPPATPPSTASRVDNYRQILDPQRRSRTAKWLRNGSLAVVAAYVARLGWQMATEQKRPVDSRTAEDPAAGDRS